MKALILLLIALVSGVVALLAQPRNNNLTMGNAKNEYPKEWRRVDSLAQAGQYNAAKDVALNIYKQAKTDGQVAQQVKALLHVGRFMNQTEEDGDQKAIALLETELQSAASPADALLHSILGDAYGMYADQNYWRIGDRTATDDAPTAGNLSTWTLSQILEKAIQHHQFAVTPTTRTVDISGMEAVLSDADNSEATRLCPTLYDLLARRAMAFLMNDRQYVAQPTDVFLLDQAEVFAPLEVFVKYSFETTDSQNARFQMLKHLQQWLGWRMGAGDAMVLADVDLFRLTALEQYSVHPDKGVLYETALKDFAKKYEGTPICAEAQYQLAKRWSEQGMNYRPNTGNDDRRWQVKKAYELCEQTAKAHPNTYGAELCKKLMAEISMPSLTFEVAATNIPNQPILVNVKHRNLQVLYAKVVKMSEDAAKRLDKINDDKDRIAFLRQQPEAQRFEIKVPNDGDYMLHSFEQPLNGLAAGMYHLLLSTDPNFDLANNAVAEKGFYVTSIAYFTTEAGEQPALYVVHAQTGEPLNAASVTIQARRYSYRRGETYEGKPQTFTTDKNGRVLLAGIRRDKEDYYQSYAIRVAYKGEVFAPMDVSYLSLGSESTAAEPTRSVLFFTDRAIYRPGQTLYFKGLALEYDVQQLPRILAGTSFEVTLTDANGQTIQTLSLTANEYGTVQGAIVLSQGGVTGAFSLSADIGGSKSLQVEEYKRPKFEVIANPVKGSFNLNDRISVTGTAKAFAGNPLEGAKVRYRVVRQASFPYWRWWLWGGYNPSQNASAQIAFGTATTDAKGNFEVTFEAKPDLSISKDQQPVFTYTVYADVTDLTGETHSLESRVSVGYVGLQLAIEVPAVVVNEEKKIFAINATNLNGEPTPATGNVLIERLQMPKTVFQSRHWQKPDQYVMTEDAFKKAFPHLAYQNEDDPATWKTEAVVLNTPFNTANADAPYTFNANEPWKAGTYKLTLTAQDKNANPITVVKLFSVKATNSASAVTNQPIVTTADKSQYLPTQTATIAFHSGFDKVKALLHVQQNGKTIRTDWVEIKGSYELKIPVTEAHRGNNLNWTLVFMKNNRPYQIAEAINVPWDNKDLSVEYVTFRDKLLPGENETWTLKISGNQKEKVAAEMVATLYDASLDAFVQNSWQTNLYPTYYSYQSAHAEFFNQGAVASNLFQQNWVAYYRPTRAKRYPTLNWFGFSIGETVVSLSVYGDVRPAPMLSLNGERQNGNLRNRAQKTEMLDSAVSNGEPTAGAKQEDAPKQPEPSIRKNLNELVFFYPNLLTDAEGNILIQFKMNEALTRWKLLGFAHTKDLRFGFTEKEVVTQKDLMVVTNPPRFLREGDQLQFAAKVTNLSKNALSGEATLQLFDALTMQPLDALLKNLEPTQTFQVQQDGSAALQWNLTIPNEGVSAVTYRVVAKAGAYSDGEENTLPVLTNRTLVTETMPLALRGKERKKFVFEAMKKASESKTLRHESLTLEFTPNPAWYAVQSLPYLMEYPHECTEQLFSRYYANTLAAWVANAHPKVKQVFDQWKNADAAALTSNLSKNQELKNVLLEETPWVFAAQSEALQKQQIALLFDLNRMSNERGAAMDKLIKRQATNGGFSWFPGGEESWYITQYFVEGMGHLRHLGVTAEASGLQDTDRMNPSVENAVKFIDRAIQSYYEDIEKAVSKGTAKWTDDHLDYMAVHYLYARSFFPEIPLQGKSRKVFDYFAEQTKTYWTRKNIYAQGMLALALYRLSDDKTAQTIVASLKNNAIRSEELGMYWKLPRGYFWHELPIETQALMIEVFNEVAKDPQIVEELKLWLLKNKQTTHWKTTKATAAAVYALLLSGEDWLSESEKVSIKVGNEVLDLAKKGITPEAGTGNFKVRWEAKSVQPEMANIEVENPNVSPAWGAIYWQYFEDFDRIKAFEGTPLKLKKDLYKVVNAPSGEQLQIVNSATKLNVGDKLKVRIELRSDRAMEYLHLKDTRASGFEPLNVISTYKWQDGLGYYESTRDAATHFFISYLRPGTYVFEYPVFVTQKGDFSTGIITIQCMYAPEFTSHSQGSRVKSE